MIGKRSIGTKDSSWSYKENAPGLRFMFIQDVRSRFRAIYGGYSPKIDDNSFLTLKHEVISTSFKDGIISSDCGFTMGKSLFKNVTFITPFAKPVGRKNGNKTKGIKKLTKKQEKWNEDVRSVRARVELP